MILLYNNDGSIKYQNFDTFIQQGSNNVNILYVAIDGYSIEQWSCSAIFTLPNQTTTNVSGIATSFQVDGTNYQGYSITLSLSETLYAGTLIMALNLINSSQSILATYRAILTVNATGYFPDGYIDENAETAITVSQYNALKGSQTAYQLAFIPTNVRAYTNLTQANSDIDNLSVNQIVGVQSDNNSLTFYQKNDDDQLVAIGVTAFYDDEGNLISATYQTITDNNLETDNKTIVGAINEVNEDLINETNIRQAETTALQKSVQAINNSVGASGGIASLDNNGQLPQSQLPDIPLSKLPQYIIDSLLFGGTIGANGVVTLTNNFVSKFGISSLTLTTNSANNYTGAYFIAGTNGVINAGDFDAISYQANDTIISLGSNGYQLLANNANELITFIDANGVLHIDGGGVYIDENGVLHLPSSSGNSTNLDNAIYSINLNEKTLQCQRLNENTFTVDLSPLFSNVAYTNVLNTYSVMQNFSNGVRIGNFSTIIYNNNIFHFYNGDISGEGFQFNNTSGSYWFLNKSNGNLEYTDTSGKKYQISLPALDASSLSENDLMYLQAQVGADNTYSFTWVAPSDLIDNLSSSLNNKYLQLNPTSNQFINLSGTGGRVYFGNVWFYTQSPNFPNNRVFFGTRESDYAVQIIAPVLQGAGIQVTLPSQAGTLARIEDIGALSNVPKTAYINIPSSMEFSYSIRSNANNNSELYMKISCRVPTSVSGGATFTINGEGWSSTTGGTMQEVNQVRFLQLEVINGEVVINGFNINGVPFSYMSTDSGDLGFIQILSTAPCSICGYITSRLSTN